MIQRLNNRYRLIRALGSGGFGETFLAEDTHMPSGRLCVVKQLKPVTDNPQAYQLIQERFQREAAILEQLSGSNRQIPQLYAYFSEGGKFFLVEEWIEGATVMDLVQYKAPLKESSVKRILVSILSTLNQVHSRGIIHRDIKPDNIIIRKQDTQPVLIDFGAVKETMGLQNRSKSSFQSIIIGTPGFMAPEQAAGCPVFSSDLYSLGLTAIFMLTEKIPQELETNHLTGEINWRKFASAVSPDLAVVIERSIQPYVQERYATAQEMLAALNASNSNVLTKLAQPTVVVSPGNRERNSNSTTVVFSSTKKVSASPSNRRNWHKTAIACSFILGIPIFLLFNIVKIEPLRSNKPVPKFSPKSSANSSDTIRQGNLKKLLATKKCRRCDLSGLNLSHANLSGTDLAGANLSEAVLYSANLFQAKLQGSDLEKAKLDSANLYGANLSNANLGNASLINANLAMARLSLTNLAEANLSNAKLQNSYLKRANLFKAQLTGANLTGAELCSSTKSSCANLDGADLKDAIGVRGE